MLKDPVQQNRLEHQQDPQNKQASKQTERGETKPKLPHLT